MLTANEIRNIRNEMVHYKIQTQDIMLKKYEAQLKETLQSINMITAVKDRDEFKQMIADFRTMVEWTSKEENIQILNESIPEYLHMDQYLKKLGFNSVEEYVDNMFSRFMKVAKNDAETIYSNMLNLFKNIKREMNKGNFREGMDLVEEFVPYSIYLSITDSQIRREEEQKQKVKAIDVLTATALANAK